jgi:glycerate kinase
MNILIAPDSFKESMTAREAAECIQRGFLTVDPSLELVLIPMADGGEGTVEACTGATGGHLVVAPVHDPLHRIIKATYGIMGNSSSAVIEMAAASGIEHLKDHEKNPMRTSTYGTGELILHAMGQGCDTIIAGIGGSATNEGGAGMLQALGAILSDANGNPIRPTGAGLKKLASINLDTLDKRIHTTKFVVASDVDNDLLGSDGATRTFGPQKGASPQMITLLENNLRNFALLMEQITGKNAITQPGSGAAGGLGFAMMVALEANLRPGFDVIAEITNLQEYVLKADLVVTGEGKIDRQTHHGKTPFGIAKMAQKANIPVVVLAGQVDEHASTFFRDHFKMIRAIAPPDLDLATALKNGPDLLEKAAARLWIELKPSFQ